MFDQLVESTNKKQTHKVWTVWVSALVQALILGVLILIPLIYTNALPSAMMTTFLVAPPPPPPPPPPAVKVIVKPQPKFIQQGKLIAPTVIPKKIQMIKEEAQPDVGMTGGVLGGVPGGSAGGALGGIIGGAPGLPPPPKPVERLRIGGNVMQANLIHQVQPVYPQIAKTAHISGSVVLHAIIAKDGTIQELQFISGPPLLRNAAMEAVKQWRYKPTLLNGQPVQVDTTITAVFNLGE
ncbi:MAG: energy transducer TonB [Candidatus Acidiferrales bacterium]